MPKLLPLTTAQAAEIIGVTANTLRQQIARGKLKAVKVGRDYLIEPAEAARYKAENIRSKYVRCRFHVPCCTAHHEDGTAVCNTCGGKVEPTD